MGRTEPMKNFGESCCVCRFLATVCVVSVFVSCVISHHHHYHFLDLPSVLSPVSNGNDTCLTLSVRCVRSSRRRRCCCCCLWLFVVVPQMRPSSLVFGLPHTVRPFFLVKGREEERGTRRSFWFTVYSYVWCGTYLPYVSLNPLGLSQTDKVERFVYLK